MKYIKVDWPEIQDYMGRSDYNENVYYDPRKNYWFIPEEWDDLEEWDDSEFGGDIGDLEDAMG